MRRFAAVAIICACQPTRVPPPVDVESCGQDVASTPGSLIVFGVQPKTDDDVVLTEDYSASPPEIGMRFAVVDERGFVGIVVGKGSEATRNCGGCGCSVSYAAAWEEHVVHSTEGGLDAIGPFRESFRAIRRLVPTPVEGDVGTPSSMPIWRPRMTHAAWDLTGDGRADLEVVHHVCESEHARAFEVWETHAGKRVLTGREVFR